MLSKNFSKSTRIVQTDIFHLIASEKTENTIFFNDLKNIIYKTL